MIVKSDYILPNVLPSVIMVGINAYFEFKNKMLNLPDALEFLEKLNTMPKINGVNYSCPWHYNPDETLVWNSNKMYEDYNNISFDDCVTWLRYIITTVINFDSECILNGHALWYNLDSFTFYEKEYNDCMRKITVVNNVIETYSVEWVNDAKCTKSANKV